MFTEDEISAVAAQLVPSTNPRSYDALGVRRTNEPFTEIQRSALSTFVLYPRSPYYLAFLGTRRIVPILRDLEEQTTSLLLLLRVLRRRPTPVRDLSSLKNARVALFELETSGAGDVGKTKALTRVQNNLNRFLSAHGATIKDGNVIVPTPQEARLQIPGALSRLEAELTDLQDVVASLAVSESDAANMRLQQAFVLSTVQRSRELLDARFSELSALTPEARLSVIRSSVLDVLGVKAAVRVVSALPTVTSLLNITGTGSPYQDSTHPATPAALLSEKDGPYVLVNTGDPTTSTNLLRLWVDGASYPNPETEVHYLPQSQIPQLDGLISGPYIITPTNNTLSVVIDGGASIPVSLTTGTRTTAQVATDITTALSLTNYRAVPFFAPLLFEGGPITVSGNTLTLNFGSFPYGSYLALQVGDTVEITYGTANVGQVRTITVAPVPPFYNTLDVSGAPLTSVTDQRIRVGNTYRLRIEPIDKILAVQNRSTIQLTTPSTLEQQTGVTLGFYGEPLNRGVPTDASFVASYLAENSRRITADTSSTVVSSGNFRTVPSSVFKTQFYEQTETLTYPAGTTITFSFSAQLNDRVVLRSGYDVGQVGIVTSLSPTVATFSPLTGDVDVVADLVPQELGPGLILSVTSGPNQGRYFFDSTSYTEQILRAPLLVTREAGDALIVPASLELERVRFTSRSTLLTSSVQTYDDTLTFFTTNGPHAATSRTIYFQLPSRVSDLEEGDFLEFFQVDISEPSSRFTIEKIEERVLRLDAEIDGLTSWTFGVSAAPFARLRKARVLDFSLFSSRSESWLESLPLEAFFKEANRLINPLLVNLNPSDSQVGSAENHVRTLLGKLTIAGASTVSADPTLSLEDIMVDYQVSPVSEVDVMLRVFREKGADRAIDVLLEGRFSEFFGMDRDSSSYSGTLQKALQAVAANDLAVRKTDRLAALSSQLQASGEDEDFETEFPDRDDRRVPVAPVPGGLKKI